MRISTYLRRSLPALLIILMLLCLNSNATAQGVGIDVASPLTKLDVNGDVSLRISSFSAVNGNNNNIAVGARSFVRIAGPTSGYFITGIAGGVNGKILILYNATGSDMYLNHESAFSAASNRIFCSDNTDALIKQKGCATLIYSTTDSRWIVISTYKQ